MCNLAWWPRLDGNRLQWCLDSCHQRAGISQLLGLIGRGGQPKGNIRVNVTEVMLWIVCHLNDDEKPYLRPKGSYFLWKGSYCSSDMRRLWNRLQSHYDYGGSIAVDYTNTQNTKQCRQAINSTGAVKASHYSDSTAAKWVGGNSQMLLYPL